MRTTGDFIVRSNEVETVYRRVDPEDWDGDGWKNEDDYNPYSWDDCNDDFYQELPYDADTNAYCWIEVRPEWNTWIDFQGDGWSNLSDPYFTARAGKTYRVWLLIGKTYSVFAPMPVSVVGRSDDRIEITDVTENSFTAVWPVMFTVAEGRAPTGRSRLGATWNDGGKSFYVMPDPDWLRGDIVWYGACCNVWGDGTNFTYACNGDCTCTGCTVYGDYLYEGYGLSVNGIPCGCHYVPDHGPFKVMQFGFDKSAAIYEDDYTNRPGVVVHPTPSNVVLRCEVYGGTYGGRLTIALNAAGRSKIARVGGNLLPNNVEIPPDTTRVFETEYTPLEPSDRVNDIEATATYVEDFRNESHTATATLTSIRLQLEAIYDAPENHNPSRHIYGVGELVNFVVEPNSSEIFLVTERYDTADDSGYGYELFGGSERISVPYADWYRCPISASNIPPIRVVYKGSEYWPTLTIVEPSEIVTTGAAWGQNAVDVQMYDGDPKCWPFGTVGSAALVTTNYVGPMHVSFMGIAMTEVPCEVEDTVTGCFATNHYKTHTTQAGAGKLHMIGDGNFFFVDGARSGAPEADWQPNSRLNWNIPIGWHRIRSDYADGKQLYGPDYEYNGAIQSRKLLVGGRIDKYKQNRHIDDSGTYRTDKFGHWISRSRWCRVVLDGTTLQWWHLW